MSDVPDALAIAVGGYDYWTSARPHNWVPTAMTISWFVGRHPCDDEPYLVGLEPRATG